MKSTLTYKIHYNGEYQDEIVITGESISEIRAKAYAQCEKRGWDTSKCWSEEIGSALIAGDWREKMNYMMSNFERK